MIASLCGRLTEKYPSRLVIDVGGVGYDVQVPLSTFYGLGERGTDVSLRVHTHVREDALSLFGFGTKLELDLFEKLIGISGVGPRMALAVLSGIEPPDLIRAIRQGDVARLTGIPGVGKKTAERIGLELKDRLPQGVEVKPPTDAPEGGELRADVLSALLNLGYRQPLSERAVERAMRASDGNFEQTLRQALRELAG
jgi:Holliday junction DNA helicase RuvA